MDILPNCILKDEKADPKLSGNGMEYLYLFCPSCGADGGRVLKTDVPHNFAFYQCDDCAAKYGDIAGTYVEPDAVFWAKMHQEQLVKYGHILDEYELSEVMKHGDNSVARLAKDYIHDPKLVL
jgi:hypothetical protein